MNNIEERIQKIESRNNHVEAEKAWETSLYRMVTISIITYIIATAVMWVINVEQPWLGALIPTLGYILSTQSIPVLKKRWIKNYK
jgi:hypothetical protein